MLKLSRIIGINLLTRLRNYVRRIPTHTKFLLLLSVDALLAWTAPRGARVNDVLVTRLDAIGDFIVWLDAARAIAEKYKREGRRVILAGNAGWADWARELEIFDDVLAIDTKQYQRNPGYRFRTGRAVQRLRCAIALQPTFSRNWLLGDSLVHVSGASERIGAAGDTSNSQRWQIAIANRWFTRLLPSAPGEQPELERNAEFVRALGEPGFRTRLPHLKLAPELDPEFAQALAGDPYYIIFPGALWKGREWPVEKFAEVARKISARTAWRCVICGGPSDATIATDLSHRVSAPVVNWVGRTSLSQLARIISGAKLLVSNETSAAHMAAAVGTPTVCIQGGGHYGRFMPYHVEELDGRLLPRVVTHPMPCFGCNWQCRYDPLPTSAVPCVRDVTTDQVWDEAVQLIELV